MRLLELTLSLLVMILLAGCTDSSQSQSAASSVSQAQSSAPPISQTQSSAPPVSQPQPSAAPALQVENSEQPRDEDLARWDKQGAVEIEIRPRNLLSPIGGLLEFDVFMNTHSVDLSMDLAALSTLETDLGLYVSAGWWSGGSGHHVQGVLTFPEKDPAGRMILEGARTITLRIVGVDVSVREFEWEALPES